MSNIVLLSRLMCYSNYCKCKCCWSLYVLTFDIGAKVYLQCRDRSDTFTFQCNTGYIINIQQATAGYSTVPGYCVPLLNAPCRRSITTHWAVVSCNGQRSCSFAQTILDYPQENISRLCDLHKDGNFVSINYACIKGKGQLCYFIRHYT